MDEPDEDNDIRSVWLADGSDWIVNTINWIDPTFCTFASTAVSGFTGAMGTSREKIFSFFIPTFSQVIFILFLAVAGGWPAGIEKGAHTHKERFRIRRLKADR